MGVKIGSEVGY